MTDKKLTTSYGIKRRRVLGAVLGAGVLGSSALAHAQTAWTPGGPVKLIVPFPAGGGIDITARLLASGLSDKLGQSIIVENRTGATGSIGSGFVYSSKPDGLTLLVTPSDSITIYPHLAKTPYDPTKFTPIASLASVAFVVVARPGLPVNNLQELIKLARTQSLSFGTSGPGSSLHMMTMDFARAAKIENLLHVPYLGTTPQLQAVMADQVDVAVSIIGSVSKLTSRMKVFAVSSAQRVAIAPDIPTFVEQGLPLTRELWHGVFAPAGTPANITSSLSKAIRDVVANPEFQAKVKDYGSTPLNLTQADFGKYVSDDYRSWGELIRAANIKLE